MTRYTLDNYEYRAAIIRKYEWRKELSELTKPDVIAFRSWLLQNHSRDVAHKVLSSFRSMILEMVSRAVLHHDIAAGVGATLRYDTPVDIPSEKEVQALLSASDRLANSRNRKIQQTWEKYRPMLYLAVDGRLMP